MYVFSGDGIFKKEGVFLVEHFIATWSMESSELPAFDSD